MCIESYTQVDFSLKFNCFFTWDYDCRNPRGKISIENISENQLIVRTTGKNKIEARTFL